MLRPEGNSLRSFFIALACTWSALAAAAVYYSRLHPGFHWIWTAAFPAFLLETLFYLSSVFENPRARLWSALRPRFRLAAVLWASGVLPYLAFALPARTFLPGAFCLVAGLAAVLSFWHALLPRRLTYDLGFLVVAAAPLLTHTFSRLYRSPDPHLRVDILGHLMWIRIGLVALLLLREWNAGPVSLWPRPGEWREGILWFAVGVLPVTAIALALHGAHWTPAVYSRPDAWWRVPIIAVGTFAGALAVISLGEELFFRGLILRAIAYYSGSTMASVLVSSVLYGAAHLWWRQFPNWQWMLVAGSLGVFCGIAYVRAGSIRASMVTHSLTIVVWRLLFT